MFLSMVNKYQWDPVQIGHHLCAIVETGLPMISNLCAANELSSVRGCVCLPISHLSAYRRPSIRALYLILWSPHGSSSVRGTPCSKVCYWSTLESVLFAGSLRLSPAQYGSNHKTIHTRRHHAHLFGEFPLIVRLISKLLVGVLQCDRHNGSMVPAIDRQQHNATFYTVSRDRFLSRWPHISRHINCYVQYMLPCVYGEAFYN